MKYTLLLALSASAVWAQVPNPTQSNAPSDQNDVPTFRVTATARSISAINYNHRDGSTMIAFVGTGLMPKAVGEAKIDSKTGATKIDVRFDKLEPAQTHGDSFLTYVMWAITPEGRPENLGEVVLSGNDARLQAATELQAFGLIVTAEPYFAVTQPSDTVVMEGVVKNGPEGTTGTISPISAKYELLEHGSYDAILPAADRAIVKQRNDIPLDLKEARHAMAIARAVGAETFAPDTMKRASTDLYNAESFWTSRKDTKRVQTLARNVTQLSEDARIITMRKLQDQHLAAERKAAEDSVASAKSETERQANLRILAETEQRQAQQRETEARKSAEHEASLRAWAESQQATLAQARLDAEQMLAKTQTELTQSQTELTQSRSELTQIRNDAEQAQITAKRESEAADAARAEAMAARNLAEQAQLAKATTEADSQRLRGEKEAADRKAKDAEAARSATEQERVQLRIQIREQLNRVLQTKDSARGLIVNMSDVLFDSGQYSVKPGAREKLAKVSGILLSHPDLKIAVEGHTDSVGGDEFNLKLSENRAKAVADYLVTQGVARESVSSAGFGKTRPVATNGTPVGRQQNRRVEMVVAGVSIEAAR